MSWPETEFGCHLILQILDLGGKKLDDRSAFGADHVVVMFVIVMMLVVCPVVTETNFSCKSRLGQKLQRPVYRCKTDAPVLSMNQSV